MHIVTLFKQDPETVLPSRSSTAQRYVQVSRAPHVLEKHVKRLPSPPIITRGDAGHAFPTNRAVWFKKAEPHLWRTAAPLCFKLAWFTYNCTW